MNGIRSTRVMADILLKAQSSSSFLHIYRDTALLREFFTMRQMLEKLSSTTSTCAKTVLRCKLTLSRVSIHGNETRLGRNIMNPKKYNNTGRPPLHCSKLFEFRLGDWPCTNSHLGRSSAHRYLSPQLLWCCNLSCTFLQLPVALQSKIPSLRPRRRLRQEVIPLHDGDQPCEH